MKLKTNAQAWYHKVKVPCRPTNEKLGLTGIRVFNVTAKQRAVGMVCVAVIDLVCGSIRVTVAESKNNPGTLYLLTPGQEKAVTPDGEVKYYESVQLKYELKAQILKYVESLTEQE